MRQNAATSSPRLVVSARIARPPAELCDRPGDQRTEESARAGPGYQRAVGTDPAKLSLGQYRSADVEWTHHGGVDPHQDQQDSSDYQIPSRVPYTRQEVGESAPRAFALYAILRRLRSGRRPASRPFGRSRKRAGSSSTPNDSPSGCWRSTSVRVWVSLPTSSLAFSLPVPLLECLRSLKNPWRWFIDQGDLLWRWSTPSGFDELIDGRMEGHAALR